MTEQEFLAFDSVTKDAILAERALGWITNYTKTGRLWANDGSSRFKCPNFTLTWTDDFWTLVRRLRSERGIYVDIHTYADFFEVAVRDNGGNELGRHSHPCVQLAVAVAVLKAFGVIEEVAA